MTVGGMVCDRLLNCGMQFFLIAHVYGRQKVSIVERLFRSPSVVRFAQSGRFHVVRHQVHLPASEASGFHCHAQPFLTAAQCVFHGNPFRNVYGHTGKMERTTFMIVGTAALGEYPANRPVRLQQPVFRRKIPAGFEGSGYLRADALCVEGMQVCGERRDGSFTRSIFGGRRHTSG